jgi:endonuclease/exonuclease/phosphatase family metal-dependent hydrolase
MRGQDKRLRLRFIGIIGALLSASMLLASCASVSNFTAPLEPRFEGNFSDEQAEFDHTIEVVSYNISYGEDVDQAISELTEFDELSGADIILLQEMDEAGTESIARSLGYNFVYYPASIHSHHKKNFGNAILSKWPISDPEKIILPYANPRNQQTRIAVKAIVTIDDIQIPTYSVHTETFWLGPKKRNAQIDTLVDSINEGYPYIIVGGDFNTLTPGSLKYLEAKFDQIGMERASVGSGYSAGIAPLVFTLDHVFAKGMPVIEVGNSEQAKASDHFPICVSIAPDLEK